MQSLDFPRPIVILVGLGFPRTLEDVQDALAFLQESPPLTDDEAYEATLQACQEAIDGRSSAGEAHDVFAAFARRRGILLDEPPPQSAMAAKEELLNV